MKQLLTCSHHIVELLKADLEEKYFLLVKILESFSEPICKITTLLGPDFRPKPILANKRISFFQHLSISIDVGLEDHLVELVVREVDVQPGHDELELGAGHEPVAVFVEHSEGLKNNLTFNYSKLGYTDIG